MKGARHSTFIIHYCLQLSTLAPRFVFVTKHILRSHVGMGVCDLFVSAVSQLRVLMTFRCFGGPMAIVSEAGFMEKGENWPFRTMKMSTSFLLFNRSFHCGWRHITFSATKRFRKAEPPLDSCDQIGYYSFLARIVYV